MPETTTELSSKIKSARLEKGYTQAELAQLTGLSLRSVQRIENGKVLPRSYTLRVIADKLGISLPTSPAKPPATKPTSSMGSIKKIILSICAALLLALLGGAFLSQAGRFPETNFEYLMFWSLLTTCYAAAMFAYWR